LTLTITAGTGPIGSKKVASAGNYFSYFTVSSFDYEVVDSYDDFVDAEVDYDYNFDDNSWYNQNEHMFIQLNNLNDELSDDQLSELLEYTPFEMQYYDFNSYELALAKNGMTIGFTYNYNNDNDTAYLVITAKKIEKHEITVASKGENRMELTSTDLLYIADFESDDTYENRIMVKQEITQLTTLSSITYFIK